MDGQSDADLLRAYAECGSEAAFAELVRRRVDLVYSAALRMVRDSHLAQDVTQRVFVALAQNAAQEKLALLEEARQKGYNFDFLSKPVHPRDLLNRLNYVDDCSTAA